MSDVAWFSIAIVGMFWALAWTFIRGLQILREWDSDE